MILFHAYKIYPDLQFSPEQAPEQESNHTDSTRWRQLQKSRWLQQGFIERSSEVVHTGPPQPPNHAGAGAGQECVCVWDRGPGWSSFSQRKEGRGEKQVPQQGGGASRCSGLRCRPTQNRQSGLSHTVYTHRPRRWISVAAGSRSHNWGIWSLSSGGSR